MASFFDHSENRENLGHYLKQVHQKHKSLDMSLFQAGQERDISFVSLSTFYVPLRLGVRPPRFDEEEKEDVGMLQREGSLVANQLLNPANRLSRHLTILGDAGSGKTTILRHLTGELARAFFQNDLQRLRRQTGLKDKKQWRIPLFIPLRHFYQYCLKHDETISQRSFLDFLAAYFANDGLVLPAAFYHQMLKTGYCLLALDGFDEVPGEDARRQLIRVIQLLAADEQMGHSHILLSSRVAAYGGSTHLGGNFQTLWVQNLNPEERAAQIEKWVDGIRPYTERQLRPKDMLRRMPTGSPLDQLATTPMIVTALCVVYFYDHELPEQRARLYRRCVDIMLYEKLRPDQTGTELANLGGSPEFKRELLARLAFNLHHQGQEATDREQAALWIKEGFRSEAEEDRLPTARHFLDAITVRGTLLQERDGAYGFGRQHLTFREFLAGYHLSLNLRPDQRHSLWPQLLPIDRWREPVRLAVGATMPENVMACEGVLWELVNTARAETAAPALRLAGYGLAAEALQDLGQKERQRLERELQTTIIAGVVACLADEKIVNPDANLLPERAVAAAALGRLGDPRPGVTSLPPLLTDTISGEFLFGQDNEPRQVAPFQAGIYPVTNAQYDAFRAAGGDDNEAWWSEDGWRWRQGKPRYDWQKMDRPDFWDDMRFDNPNQPVVSVTYYEAEAFCHWLSAEYEREYRLPTEEEWEHLARGPKGRLYPWGNEWQENAANTSELDLGAPCAVGLFAENISPVGAIDCAGNVWEWCLLEGNERDPWLKGGSWTDAQEDARSWARYAYFLPNGSFDSYGFRVVAPIP